MIWASRNKSGTIDADKLHSSVDRPKEKRESKLETNSALTTKDQATDTTKKEVGLKSNGQASEL